MLAGEEELASFRSSLRRSIRVALQHLGVWRAVSLGLLLYLFLLAVTRAVNQSITADEAFNYERFLTQSLSYVFTAPFDANNHVLYSALAKISIKIFRLSEFSLRIPSLAAAAIFFTTVFKLASFCFRRRPLHLLAVVILAGNPYLLDFFTLARGYGLASAFFLLALFHVISAPTDVAAEPPKLFRIGIYSALAVCSNLIFLVPVCALFLVFTIQCIERAGRDLTRLKTVEQLIQLTFGPFLVLCFAILVIPLHTAKASDFYLGAPTWHITIDSLIQPSLLHNLKVPLLRHYPSVFGFIYTHSVTQFIPALTFLVLAVAIYATVRQSVRNGPLFVLSVLFTVDWLVLWAAHVALGMKLPIMRTGLYFVFLLPLALLILLTGPPKSPERRIGLAICPILVVLALIYVPQWSARATADWRFDASTRRFAEAIETIRAYTGTDNVTIGGSWLFEPSLNFYRIKNHYEHWQPIVRQSADDPADFYVLSKDDRQLADTLHLRIVFDDPISQSILATPQ